jgi:hypothetical protein
VRVAAVTVAALLALLALLPTAAVAKGKPGGGGGKTSTGYDISYPQCGAPLPSNVLFGIVGVNNGIVFSANPCLSTQLSWAQRYEAPAILYANTGDPGPALSSHWPVGQASPQICDPAAPDSSACSYDYGWNAATDSYRDAVAAYVALGQAPTGATQTPQPNEWWLDVETANSWEQNTTNNIAELQGEIAYLQSVGISAIGVYSSASDWQTITGSTTVFSALPSWKPGAGSQATAQASCGTIGVTGGPIKYSQYAAGSYDADVRCY